MATSVVYCQYLKKCPLSLILKKTKKIIIFQNHVYETNLYQNLNQQCRYNVINKGEFQKNVLHLQNKDKQHLLCLISALPPLSIQL